MSIAVLDKLRQKIDRAKDEAADFEARSQEAEARSQEAQNKLLRKIGTEPCQECGTKFTVGTLPSPQRRVIVDIVNCSNKNCLSILEVKGEYLGPPLENVGTMTSKNQYFQPKAKEKDIFNPENYKFSQTFRGRVSDTYPPEELSDEMLFDRMERRLKSGTYNREDSRRNDEDNLELTERILRRHD